MLNFMDLVQNAWLDATDWNRDNSYAELNATAQAILGFSTPRGLHFSVSSLTTPHLFTSYTLGNVGLVDGSLSYLYSSIPLSLPSTQSSHIPLQDVISGYRQIQEIRNPDEPWWWEVWHGGRRIDRRDTLLYGRLYLPNSRLEGLYQRRLSPTRMLVVQGVSSSTLKDGGTILALHTTDTGLYSLTTLLSTDSLLLGIRGLYNFSPSSTSTPTSSKPRTTRLTLGAEAYYGLLNTTLGLSSALRLSTLPNHPGPFPFTSTLTLNPLMGQLGCTYAVKASRDLCLASEFGFNVYSYESDVRVGLELWRRRRRRQQPGPGPDLAWARAKMDVLVQPAHEPDTQDDITGVLKARVDQRGRIGVLWEGRAKELLFSAGATFDLRRRERWFRGVGVEVMYSS